MAAEHFDFSLSLSLLPPPSLPQCTRPFTVVGFYPQTVRPSQRWEPFLLIIRPPSVLENSSWHAYLQVIFYNILRTPSPLAVQYSKWSQQSESSSNEYCIHYFSSTNRNPFVQSFENPHIPQMPVFEMHLLGYIFKMPPLFLHLQIAGTANVLSMSNYLQCGLVIKC